MDTKSKKAILFLCLILAPLFPLLAILSALLYTIQIKQARNS
ncbi:hypothetical protein [Vagococcus allomyrinae]|nr:hypothetical protein [Vagococcus allomyrinae]